MQDSTAKWHEKVQFAGVIFKYRKIRFQYSAFHSPFFKKMTIVEFLGKWGDNT